MWLINFHLGFSILLLAAYIGIGCMFRKDIKNKISGLKPKKKGIYRKLGHKAKLLLFLFIPGVNIITMASLLFVIAANKKDLEIIYNYGEGPESDT